MNKVLEVTLSKKELQEAIDNERQVAEQKRLSLLEEINNMTKLQMTDVGQVNARREEERKVAEMRHLSLANDIDVLK